MPDAHPCHTKFDEAFTGTMLGSLGCSSPGSSSFLWVSRIPLFSFVVSYHIFSHGVHSGCQKLSETFGSIQHFHLHLRHKKNRCRCPHSVPLTPNEQIFSHGSLEHVCQVNELAHAGRCSPVSASQFSLTQPQQLSQPSMHIEAGGHKTESDLD